MEHSALATLTVLRWIAVALFAAIAFVASAVAGYQMPLAGLGGIVGLAVISNLGIAYAPERITRKPWVVGATVLFDIVLLTALLAMTGGPTNPFSVLYVVYVALAATLLASHWMWIAAITASLAFASLFFIHLPLPAELGGGHAHHGNYGIHLQGMWLAFVVAAAAVVAFVSRLAASLRKEREERARASQLLGLATLAAGAAHEIGNPLATIRVAADELHDRLKSTGGDPETLNDLELINLEVDRARSVLDRLAAGAGELDHGSTEATELSVVLATAIGDLDSDRERIRVVGADEVPPVRWPIQAASQAFVQLLRNALQAGQGDVVVTCHYNTQRHRVEIDVLDHGFGMPAHVAAKSTEPFFTTRPAEGMGLGLFITRSLVEHLGGEIRIESWPQRGTRVRLALPNAGVV